MSMVARIIKVQRTCNYLAHHNCPTPSQHFRGPFKVLGGLTGADWLGCVSLSLECQGFGKRVFLKRSTGVGVESLVPSRISKVTFSKVLLHQDKVKKYFLWEVLQRQQ